MLVRIVPKIFIELNPVWTEINAASHFSFIFELYCVPRERLHDRCGTGSHSEAMRSNPIEFGVEAQANFRYRSPSLVVPLFVFCQHNQEIYAFILLFIVLCCSILFRVFTICRATKRLNVHDFRFEKSSCLNWGSWHTIMRHCRQKHQQTYRLIILHQLFCL